MRHECENIVLVSGTGRNVGKTTFCCMLLNNFRGKAIGIKISPHTHPVTDGANILIDNKDFMIFQENNRNGKKDSSKMLVSGAKVCYYIQAVDENLSQAFQFLQENFIHNEPVVCESAALGRVVKPALHFKIAVPGQTAIKHGQESIPYDLMVMRNQDVFDFNIKQLELNGNKWSLNKTL